MKSRMALVAGLLLLTGLASACGKKQEVAAEKPVVVTGVKLETAALAPLEDFYEATGTVKSRTTTTLSARTMGTVVALRVHEGDRVSAGQTVVEIDNREAAAQLQKAQAGLLEAQAAQTEVEQSSNGAQAAKAAAEANKRLAQATFNRYQTLLERKSVSAQEFDEVKAKLQIAEAEVERADKMLQMIAAKKAQVRARIDQARADITNAQVYAGYARITSPITGIVIAKTVEVGSTATPGAPLLTIEDSTRYRLEAAVEESQLRRIRLRDAARVQIDALGNAEFDATVGEICRPQTPRAAAIPSNSIRHRKACCVRECTARRVWRQRQRQAPLIPQAAPCNAANSTGVFIMDKENVARLRLVKTGKTVGGQVELLSGWQEGERFVTEGAAKLNDGNRVQ
ncbi:MAG: efflux RND transporter periplasmic adaptor subunit [Acidobacteriota bacterium]